MRHRRQHGEESRVLERGRHRLFDPSGRLTAETFNVVRTEFPADRHAMLKAARPCRDGQGLDALLTRLVRLKPAESA